VRDKDHLQFKYLTKRGRETVPHLVEDIPDSSLAGIRRQGGPTLREDIEALEREEKPWEHI
jgi:hypothetical protein